MTTTAITVLNVTDEFPLIACDAVTIGKSTNEWIVTGVRDNRIDLCRQGRGRRISTRYLSTNSEVTLTRVYSSK